MDAENQEIPNEQVVGLISELKDVSLAATAPLVPPNITTNSPNKFCYCGEEDKVFLFKNLNLFNSVNLFYAFI